MDLFCTLRRRVPTSESGFSLVEAIVSMAMLGVVAAASAYALLGLIATTRTTQNRVAASNLARQEVERLRLQSNTGHELDSAPRTVTLKSTTYTVTPSYAPLPQATCDATNYRRVSVVVTWNSLAGRQVRYDTELAC